MQKKKPRIICVQQTRIRTYVHPRQKARLIEKINFLRSLCREIPKSQNGTGDAFQPIWSSGLKRPSGGRKTPFIVATAHIIQRINNIVDSAQSSR